MIKWKIPENACINVFTSDKEKPQKLLIYKFDITEPGFLVLLANKNIKKFDEKIIRKTTFEMPSYIHEIPHSNLFVFCTDLSPEQIYDHFIKVAFKEEIWKQ